MNFNYSIDTQNFRDQLRTLPIQIEKAADLVRHIKIEQRITKIAIVGMGGSALPGEILKNYLKDEQLPVYVVR